MAEPSGRAIIERYSRALQDKDFDALALLVTDDYVDEMPQSGERVRGKANQLALLRNYPGGVGTIDPTSTRLVGSEDRWVTTWGDSVGRWEGDTLVIDTIAVREPVKFFQMVPPFSDQAHYVERLRKTAPDRIESQFTIDVDELDRTQVQQTWIAGEKVYDREE